MTDITKQALDKLTEISEEIPGAYDATADGMPKAPPTCEMERDCTSEVTHIGDKGYIYCESHAARRRSGGRERCRKMTPAEVQLIKDGKTIKKY